MPNVCDICNKTFSTSYGLKRHLDNSINTHKNILPKPETIESIEQNPDSETIDYDIPEEVMSLADFEKKVEKMIRYKHKYKYDINVVNDPVFINMVLKTQKEIIINLLYMSIVESLYQNDDGLMRLLIGNSMPTTYHSDSDNDNDNDSGNDIPDVIAVKT